LGQLKGILPLRDCEVELLTEPADGIPHCFVVNVKSKNKRYLFCAATANEQQDWFEAILWLSRGVRTTVEDVREKRVRETRASILLYDQRIEKSGFLSKEGHQFWFFLSQAKLTSSLVYSDQKEGKKKGEIALRASTCKRVTGPEHSFVIHTVHSANNEDVILSADTEVERDEWVDVIQTAITSLEQEQAFVDNFLK